MAAFLTLAGFLAGPVSAIELISFEEVPAQNTVSMTLTEEYAHLGVHFSSNDDGSTWDGMSLGDPGGWELEGTNGPTFAGFNGASYRLAATFDAPIYGFSLDVSAASGADPATLFTLAGYRDGVLVESNAVTLGALNQWMTVALTQELDQVVVVGQTRGFRPFGIDNLRWGTDPPSPEPEPDPQPDPESEPEPEPEPTPTRLDVAIDVKPGNRENPVNPGARGVLAVALLGSAELDVMDVDPESLALGVNGAPAVHRKYRDANHDGWLDLVAHYRVSETGTAYGDASMCLTGATLDGVDLAGCDTIRTVPKPTAAGKKPPKH